MKRISLIGKTFGRLKVVDKCKKRSTDGKIMWNCKCICGTIKAIRGTTLRSGKSKSCGCLQRQASATVHLKNIVGRIFGRLTVVRRKDKQWQCECSCGSTVLLSRGKLVTGNTRSCGCLKRERLRAERLIDLVGKRFGRLIVLGLGNKPKRSNNPQAFWRCRCDCGTVTVVVSQSLRAGRIKSCGCLNRELSRQRFNENRLWERVQTDPKLRAQWLKTIRTLTSSPEYREKQSETTRANWSEDSAPWCRACGKRLRKGSLFCNNLQCATGQAWGLLREMGYEDKAKKDIPDLSVTYRELVEIGWGKMDVAAWKQRMSQASRKRWANKKWRAKMLKTLRKARHKRTKKSPPRFRDVPARPIHSQLQVICILERHFIKSETYTAIGQDYGVGHTQISRICHGLQHKKWVLPWLEQHPEVKKSVTGSGRVQLEKLRVKELLSGLEPHSRGRDVSCEGTHEVIRNA